MIGSAFIGWFILLLALLQLKHYLVDFVLQGQFMIKRGNSRRWVRALSGHAITHGLGSVTFLIIPAVVIDQVIIVLLLCLVETMVHFLIDTARLRLFHYNVFQPRYWTVHGVDQLLHGYTYVAMVAVICYIGQAVTVIK